MSGGDWFHLIEKQVLRIAHRLGQQSGHVRQGALKRQEEIHLIGCDSLLRQRPDQGHKGVLSIRQGRTLSNLASITGAETSTDVKRFRGCNHAPRSDDGSVETAKH
jgi:hypothetical protein